MIGQKNDSFRLRRYFSIAAGLLMLAVTLPLTYGYYRSEVREMTELVGMRNAALAQTYANTLWPAVGEFLLRGDLDAAARRRADVTEILDEHVRQMSRGVEVIKIKAFNRDGVAVFSTVRSEIGEDKSGNSGFRSARDGQQVNELTHRGRISGTEGESYNVDVVSTYIPIRGDKSDDEVMAVFELYSDVTATVAHIERVTMRLLVILLAAFFVLYLSLLAIVARADRIIQGQYRALGESEAALRRSEELAASASRAKSEFLSSMSHELRTPMNAILGFAQLLESEPDAPLREGQQRFVRQIIKAGEHLLALIDQVLDLARIEAGKMTLSLETVSIAGVLDETLPMVQHLARQKGIGPVDVDVGELGVVADYGRLKQVLLNLLSNAIKYNVPGGSVSVSAVPADGHVRIAVRDTGRGIAPERMAELFQPFSRLGVESTAIEGTGIGLAVTKRMVEAMGGALEVESVEGSGSTFHVCLPAAPVQSRDAVALQPAPAGGAMSVLPDAEQCVLYIEDNPANVLLMEGLVGRLRGVRLMSAHTAEIGIALAHQEHPDLVIMDINLPGMDGFQALAALRSARETEDIPVIALSANAMPKAISRGLAAGFRSYHTKPIQVEAFMRTVREILKARGKAS